MKLQKRVLSLFLSVLMAAGVLACGFSAFAAEPLDPYNAEDAVMIYLNNINIWQPEIALKTIYFIDLDLNGINELLCAWSVGSSAFFDVDYYTIDPSNNTVKKLYTSNEYPDQFLSLYRDPDDGSFFFLAEDYSRSGWMYSDWKYYKVYMKNNYIFMFPFLETSKEYSSAKDTVPQETFYEYTGTSYREITKAAYNAKMNALETDYNNLHMQNGLAHGIYGTDYLSWSDFKGYTSSKKKTALLEAYRYFQYDPLVFQENSYIADLWLGLRGKSGSMESNAVKDILSYTSFSTEMYEKLRKDKSFQIPLMGWELAKSVFDMPDTVKKAATEEAVYESLIFDLLKKVMEDNAGKIYRLTADACSDVSTQCGYVTKVTGWIDKITGLVSNPNSALLDLLKKWQDPNNPGESLNNWISSLSKTKDTLDEWSDSELKAVAKDIGTLADYASSVGDFYTNLSNYMLAVEMSKEMCLLLQTMRQCTSDDALRRALDHVQKAFQDVDYAALASCKILGRDLSLDFVGSMIDTATALCPEYALLKATYGAAVSFTDILLNTSNTVQAYYGLAATKNFIGANKAAVSSLAAKYRSSHKETDAGAYVYAMQTYRHVYEMDLDSTLTFIEAASEEGFVNRLDSFSRNAANLLFKLDLESDYDTALRHKTGIMNSIDMQFDLLLNNWIFDTAHLKTDYPTVYPVYAAKAYNFEAYAPQIIGARLNEDGAVKLTWNINGYYKDANGKIHALYGASLLTGVQVESLVDGLTEIKTEDYALGKHSVTFTNTAQKEVFPKTFTARGYEELNGEKIYTAASTAVVESPCGKVTLRPSFAGASSFTIRDTAFLLNGTVYRIYRQAEGGEEEEIDVIDRSSATGGLITAYADRTAEAGTVYTYRVISEYTATDGTVFRSESGDPLRMKTLGSPAERVLRLKDLRSGESSSGQNKAVRKAPAESSGAGIELTWDAAEGAAGYEIYRKAAYASVFTLLGAAEEPAFYDATAAYTVGYDYYVVPFYRDDAGETVYSVSEAAAAGAEGLEPEEIPTPVISGVPGDVSGDGMISAEDARLALRRAVGLETYAEGTKEFYACDVSGDGKVTAEDARSILRAAVGLEDTAAWRIAG